MLEEYLGVAAFIALCAIGVAVWEFVLAGKKNRTQDETRLMRLWLWSPLWALAWPVALPVVVVWSAILVVRSRRAFVYGARGRPPRDAGPGASA